MALSSMFRRITSSLLHPVPSPATSFSRSFAASAVKDGKNARKQHKGVSTKGIADNPISFGRFALQSLDFGRLTTRQIEAGRRAISRLVQRGGKIWVRVVADKPVSGKAVGIRMGKGKGAIQYWASVVKPGKLIYELDGVPEFVAKRALAIAGDKMPIATRCITAR